MSSLGWHLFWHKPQDFIWRCHHDFGSVAFGGCIARVYGAGIGISCLHVCHLKADLFSRRNQDQFQILVVPQGLPSTTMVKLAFLAFRRFEHISSNIKHQRCPGSKWWSCESLCIGLPSLFPTLGQVGLSDHEASKRLGALMWPSCMLIACESRYVFHKFYKYQIPSFRYVQT